MSYDSNITTSNTYACSSQQIDFIFCTANILPHCQCAGALPFGTGYHSDHRALFITINFEDFFNTKLGAIDTIAARKLIQASPKERKKNHGISRHTISESEFIRTTKKSHGNPIIRMELRTLDRIRKMRPTINK
jgi:hypothetical protein